MGKLILVVIKVVNTCVPLPEPGGPRSMALTPVAPPDRPVSCFVAGIAGMFYFSRNLQLSTALDVPGTCVSNQRTIIDQTLGFDLRLD